MPAREAPSRRLCSRASGRRRQLLDLVRPAEPVGEPDRLGRVSGAIVDQHPDAGRLRAAARSAAAVPAPAVRLLQLDLPRHLRVSVRGGLEAVGPPLAGALRLGGAPAPGPSAPGSPATRGLAADRLAHRPRAETLVEQPRDVLVGRVLQPRRRAEPGEARARACPRERLEAGGIRLPLESVPELRVLVLLVHELRGERPPGLRVERREMQQLRAPRLGTRRRGRSSRRRAARTAPGSRAPRAAARASRLVARARGSRSRPSSAQSSSITEVSSGATARKP